MSKLLELAERVERAPSVGSGILDEVERLTGIKLPDDATYHTIGNSMVPPGFYYEGGGTGGGAWACVTHRISYKDYASRARSRSAALLAAALRARAAQESQP